MDNLNYGCPIPQVVLLACGSFNPPTFMHLRMFEIARDYLNRKGQLQVIGGVISPVHDAYGKKELEHSTHRIAMLNEAIKNSDWIKISTWETQQECWTKTRSVLQYHQNYLNAVLNDTADNMNLASWIPDSLLKNRNKNRKIIVKLLCGGDLLETFAVPGLWANEDIQHIIGEHGLVVISRIGSQPEKFVYESDLLYPYSPNIEIVTEWITNEVCSSKVRRALKRRESVKYIIPDGVIDYINVHRLYGINANNSTSNINENKYLLPPNVNAGHNMPFTPSPSDISSSTPSPLDNIYYTYNGKSEFLAMSIDTVDAKNKLNTTKATSTGVATTTTATPHLPGQAVKIITELTGEHKVLNTTEVGNSSKQQNKITTVACYTPRVSKFKNDLTNVSKINYNSPLKVTSGTEKLVSQVSSSSTKSNIKNTDTDLKNMKSAISCQNFNNTNLNKPHRTRIKSSKSNSEISNCDENLIKFIFTKHGIQVISDIETAV